MSFAHTQKISNGAVVNKEPVKPQRGSKERWIQYSTCDEDSNSEIWALNITPSDTVLCVTGSGCRTLSLLACNPQSIISIDYSAGQNYLLEMKLAAIRNLSYDTLLQFFGVEDHYNRWEIFCSLEEQISPKAGAYFRAHQWAIKRGILFTGRHELFYIRFTAPLMRLLFGHHFDRIFHASTLEEQRSIYQKHVSGRLWRWLISLGFSPMMFRYVFKDQDLFIETNVNMTQYLLERLDHTFSYHLAKDNHWISLMFNGKYPGRHCLPHFLLKENYLAIRQATTNVELVTADLIDYVKQLPDQFVNKYSLSDVSSYMKGEKFEGLLREVARTSRVKGRLCYRNFLNKCLIPLDLQEVMQRDDLACSSLNWNDLAFVYTFEIATIK